MRAPVMLLGLALTALIGPRAVASPPAETRAEAVYADLALEWLQHYLQVDTTVPPGNELRGARFYAEILKREGLDALVDEFAPGRANLLARLPGSGKQRPLVLSNHIDVVPADPARWSVAPFSGLLKDGLIYGRGAQDMKTEGILQLAAFVRLAREKVRLDRDVLFLATADEEEGFAGVLRATSRAGFLPQLESAEYLITEGGENPLGDNGQPLYFGIATGEKAPLWLALSVKGTPGHGSRPLVDSAPNRLIRALERVRRHRTPLRLLPSVERFLRDQASSQTGDKARWFADPAAALRDPVASAALHDDRDVGALLSNTISITVVKLGYKTNVIPGVAEAELDVRLLPGEDDQAFLRELRNAIDDPSVEIRPLQEFRAPNDSPADSPLVQAARKVLARRYPSVPVTTTLLSGATESVVFRPLGIRSYGFTTLLATPDEIATTHGDDERVQATRVREATGAFYDVVQALVAAP